MIMLVNLLLLASSFVAGQEPQSQALNPSYKSELSNEAAVSLEKYLPRGFVKDASVDYTEYIQRGLDNEANLIFPAFPLLINDTGLQVRSNSVLSFLKGSELRLVPSWKKTYAILNISNVSNVLISNPVIKGDRFTHLGKDGEWGMGIAIKGSRGITIEKPYITECWGDGIYIGQFNNRNNCENIIIRSAYLKKNRRDGISVISVDGLLLQDIYAAYTDGTKPMAGINFEPNNPLCELRNIKVINAHTEYNGSRGIQIALKHFVGETKKTSDITIVRHIDVGSPDNAFKLSVNPLNASSNLYGYVKIFSPSWNKTLNGVPLNLSSNQENYLTHIYSPKVTTLSGRSLSVAAVEVLLAPQKKRAKFQLVR